MLDRLIMLALGGIFLWGGVLLARKAFNEDLHNVAEPVLFGVMGICFGLFLLYVAIAGYPG